MNKNTKHFKIDKELRCKCGKCEMVEIDFALVALLELVRNYFKQPVIITSGYRCPKHNKAVGGAVLSQHVQGTAVDIKVKNVSPSEVYKFLDGVFPNSLGLAMGKTFVHIDTRHDRAYRWNY